MQTELELIEGLVDDFSNFKIKSLKDFNAFKDNDFQTLQTEFNNLQDQLKELKARGGRMSVGPVGEQTTRQLIKAAVEEDGHAIANLTKQARIAHTLVLKTVGIMTAANHLTGSVQSSYDPNPAVRGRTKLHFRDLVNVVPSATGLWTFYRSNTPAGEGSFGFQNTHFDLKPRLDYDFTEVNILVQYLAGVVKVAKQMLQDLPWLSNFLSTELVEDYLRAEDHAFFGSLYSAATGVAGSSTVTAEKIIQSIANIEENDHSVNGIVVTNAVWAKLLLTKGSVEYGLPGATTITNSGEIMIAGVPVYKTSERNIGANRMLIGDWTKAKIIQAEGLNVQFSEHDEDNFQRNVVSVKCEARVNLAVGRPEAFVWTTAGTT